MEIPKILIIEHEPFIAEIINTLLYKKGFGSAPITDSFENVSNTASLSTPEILIMDIIHKDDHPSPEKTDILYGIPVVYFKTIGDDKSFTADEPNKFSGKQIDENQLLASVESAIMINKLKKENLYLAKRLKNETARKRIAQKNAEQFEKILDDSFNEIYIFDSKTFLFLRITSGAQKNLGYSLEELKKMTLLDIKPENTRKEFVKIADSLLYGEKKKAEFKTFHRRKNGTTYPVEINLQITNYKSKAAFIAITHDTTFIDNTSTALKESEEKYRLLFDKMMNAFALHEIILDESEKPSDYRFLEVNPAFEIMTGLKAEQLIGKTLLEVMPDSDYFWIETYGNVALTGEPAHFRKFFNVLEKWFEITAFSPRNNHFAVIFHDITANIVAEEALKESEERYRKLFENAPVGIELSTLEGKVLTCNAFMENINGFTLEEMKTFNIQDTYANPDDRTSILEELEKTGFVKDFETKIKRTDNSIVIVRMTISKLQIHGSYTLLTIVEDITERKVAEEQKKMLEEQLLQSQKMESIGRLAGGIAHDFNNLLTTIIGNTELLLTETNLDGDVEEEILEIRKSAERAANLTRQLLAFSRRQIIEPRIVDLTGILSEMDKMFRRLIGENIEFVTILEKNLWLVEIDIGQVEQILTNLIINSKDALPFGGRITIETANVYLDSEYTEMHSQVESGDYVMLAVSDTGMGINVETLPHIFEPFFTTKEKGKGTGLGLSTCYGIVKQNGGYIWVYSEAGKGTTIKVYLRRSQKESSDSVKPDISNSISGGNETILVVEDETTVKAMIIKILKSKGYNIIEASDGKDAIARATMYGLNNIDLLITDVIMPHIGGKELSEKLQVLSPKIKTLYISGYTENSMVHHGIIDEGISFLPKPFSPGALLVKVREILDIVK